MTEILILKTGALGDVVRTTSILPGLHQRYPACRVTWVTAPGAVDLVRLHPLVERVVAFDAGSPADLESLSESLGVTTYERLISLDDEELCCRLASALPTKRLSGAHFDASERRRAYTPDVGPWFDMGLLSVHGKLVADQMKIENERSHATIFAEMLGLSRGHPRLEIDAGALTQAARFAERTGLERHGPVIGLNTGAGGRWTSKALPIERTAALAEALHAARSGEVAFLLLGGPEEAERNRELLLRLEGRVNLVDGGTDNDLFTFAGLVSLCQLLITSDSLALHVGVAREVRVVAFFAPTSAAEIELYGRGEKVVSTAPDACSYRPDADTSTLTVERLLAASLRQLEAR